MDIRDNYIRHIHSIESIYDGDTVTAIVETGYNGLDRVTFRLKDINAAEIKGSTGERKALAEQAKAHVQEKLSKGEVRVHSEKFKSGGFGRFEGTLFYRNELNEWVNLNIELLEIGLAQGYYKGASKDFGEWKA